VVYTTAEAFTNEYINALRASRLETFRRSYRAVKLLCIDDVQFFSNKQATQGELLHTFDAIDLEGARIVLASDEHPRAVRKFSSALVSRFMAGMVVRLDAPEPALRQRIVLHLALKRGLRLEPAAASLIASRCTPPSQACSVRDLEGTLTRIEALLRLHPELAGSGDCGEVGLVLVRRAIGADAAAPISGPRRPIRAEQILEEVCRTLHVDHGEIVGKGRHKRVVLARSVTAHLCRGLTTLSFPEIARAMGRPNHSTVVTACNRIQHQLAADAELALGAEHLPELNGLKLRGLIDQVRDDILRSAPGA
jgi:chromosomal replication initiator protein